MWRWLVALGIILAIVTTAIVSPWPKVGAPRNLASLSYPQWQSPIITGTTTQGQALSTTNGTWTGNPTAFAYQWEDCDGSGNNCIPISGANSSNYTLGAGDVGDTIRVVVTARNATGAATATSGQTAPIGSSGGSPALVSEPVVTGTVATGQVLSTSNGSWTGSPTGYAYQWQDCATDGTSCSNISGATSSTYTVASGDAGHTLESVVTATNGSGSTPADAPIVPLVDNFTGTHLDTNVWTALNQQGDTSNSEIECYEPGQVTEGSSSLTEAFQHVATFACPGQAGGNGTPANGACTGTCSSIQQGNVAAVWKSGAVQESATAFTYGTIVVKAKMASQANGAWPAIWMEGATCQTSSTSPFTFLSGTSGTNTGYFCPWPDDSQDSAEIDIAEGNTGNETTVGENLHATAGSNTCTSGTITDYSTNFHVYELDWTSGSLVFKIDGTTQSGCTVSGSNVPSHPMFLIIQTAQAGSNTTGGSTVIDYVHVSH